MISYTKLELDNIANDHLEKFIRDKASAIKLIGTNLMEYPELIKFMGSESFEVIMKKGLVSLKRGFYKIIGQPYEKDYGNGITTFAAKVLYFEDIEDNMCIEYEANIGPIVNAEAQYSLLGGDGSQDQLLRDFLQQRNKDKSKNFSYSKGLFFNKVYILQKSFWIQSAEFSEKKSDYKKVHWSFFK